MATGVNNQGKYTGLRGRLGGEGQGSTHRNMVMKPLAKRPLGTQGKIREDHINICLKKIVHCRQPR
jgi:hypothetical protein